MFACGERACGEQQALQEKEGVLQYYRGVRGAQGNLGGLGWESQISRPGSAEQTAVQCPCRSPHPRPHCL